MSHMKFNWIDVLFVTLLVRSCYVGFKKGLLLEIFRGFGLLIAVILSFDYYTIVSQLFSAHTRWTGPGPDIISFLVIFLSVLIIFKVFSQIASLFLGGEKISIANRVIGLVFGLGRGLLAISLIGVLFINSPFGYLSKSVKDRAWSGQYVLGIAPGVYKTYKDFWPREKVETPLVKVLEM